MSAPGENVTAVDFLRHGACEGGEIYRGSTDVPLSSAGWQQMAEAVGATANWQRIVTSPLVRCRAFAEHCAQQFALPLRVVPALQEVNFGAWEGRLTQEVWQGDQNLVSRYYDDPGAVTPPGGESTADALQRIVTGWRLLLHEFAGEHVLLVCHGGVIRLLLGHLLGMPLTSISRLYLPYASMSQVRIYHREGGDFPVLMSLNGGANRP